MTKPRKENAFGVPPKPIDHNAMPLADLSSFMDEYVKITGEANPILYNKLYEHLTKIGDKLIILEKEIIQIKLAEIFSFFKNQNISSDLKLAIAQKLEERAVNCTAGLAIGLQLLEISKETYSIPEMLFEIRQSLCESVAIQESDEVHHQNAVYIFAEELGFGIRPPVNKKQERHFSIVSNSEKQQFKSLLIQKFDDEYQFPYVFSSIMEKIKTLYDIEVDHHDDGSIILSDQSATKIKNALKQLIPALKKLEETAEKYKKDLEESRNKRDKLLEPFKFTEEELIFFKIEGTYTKEELDRLNQELLEKQALKRDSSLILEIRSLKAQIAVYEKVLPNAHKLTDEVKKNYIKLTESIKKKRANPPETVDDIIFLTDDRTYQQSLNIKKIQALLWQELQQYFEFSKEEKSGLDIIYQPQGTEESIKAAIAELIKKSTGSTQIQFINAYARYFNQEEFKALLDGMPYKVELFMRANIPDEYIDTILENMEIPSLDLRKCFNLFQKNKISSLKIHKFISKLTPEIIDKALNPPTKIIYFAEHISKSSLNELLSKYRDKDSLKKIIKDNLLLNPDLIREKRPTLELLLNWYLKNSGIISENDIIDLFRNIDAFWHGGFYTISGYVLSMFKMIHPKLDIDSFKNYHSILDESRFAQHLEFKNAQSFVDFCLDDKKLPETRQFILKDIDNTSLIGLNMNQTQYEFVLPILLKTAKLDSITDFSELDELKKHLMTLNEDMIETLLQHTSEENKIWLIKNTNYHLITDMPLKTMIQLLLDSDYRINFTEEMVTKILQKHKDFTQILESPAFEFFYEKMSFEQFQAFMSANSFESFTQKNFETFIKIYKKSEVFRNYAHQNPKGIVQLIDHSKNDAQLDLTLAEFFKTSIGFDITQLNFQNCGLKTYVFLINKIIESQEPSTSEKLKNILVNICDTVDKFQYLKDSGFNLTKEHILEIFKNISSKEQSEFLKIVRGYNKVAYEEITSNPTEKLLASTNPKEILAYIQLIRGNSSEIISNETFEIINHKYQSTKSPELLSLLIENCDNREKAKLFFENFSNTTLTKRQKSSVKKFILHFSQENTSSDAKISAHDIIKTCFDYANAPNDTKDKILVNLIGKLKQLEKDFIVNYSDKLNNWELMLRLLYFIFCLVIIIPLICLDLIISCGDNLIILEIPLIGYDAHVSIELAKSFKN